MRHKKKIILILATGLFLGLIFYFGIGYIKYIEYNNVANASFSMPWSDGAYKVLSYPLTKQGPCLLNLPLGCPEDSPCVGCSACPLLTGAFGPGCQMYTTEIGVLSQKGTLFVGIPPAFSNYLGCPPVKEGDQLLMGGAANVQPWVIANSCPQTRVFGKVYDWINKYVIAGFKK